MEIKVKYFSDIYGEEGLNSTKFGDWIDLRVDNIKEINGEPYDGGVIKLRAGMFIKVGLGIAMELLDGYEAVVAPRSSTRKNFGLMLTNSIGVIDNSYCGDSDEWMAEFLVVNSYAKLELGDRVCQFRIQEKQPDVTFKKVDKLGNKDRGGYGTSGRR